MRDEPYAVWYGLFRFAFISILSYVVSSSIFPLSSITGGDPARRITLVSIYIRPSAGGQMSRTAWQPRYAARYILPQITRGYREYPKD